MSKTSSAKHYQDKKWKLQKSLAEDIKDIFLKKKKNKNNVNRAKISQKMKKKKDSWV